MKIKAILFDLDGTLRDTREAIYYSLEHALSVHGSRIPTREEMASVIHHHTEVHHQFAPHIDIHEFESTYREKVDGLVTESVLYVGAKELIETLHNEGYKLAVVSSAIRVEQYLQKTKLHNYFDVFVNGSDTAEHKPHPAPVVLALERLGVQPNEAVMVGDLSADIKAARQAGVATLIGITHGFGNRDSLEDAGANYVVDSLEELSAVLKQVDSY
jgi:pyrophosphatase PpaX